MAKVYTAKDFLQITDKVYKIAGWSYNLDSIDPKFAKLHEIYYWTLNSFCILINLQAAIFLIQNVGKPDSLLYVTENVLCIGFMVMLILKSYFVVYRNRKVLTQMIDDLDRVMPKVQLTQVKYEIELYCNRTRIVSITCSIIYWSLMISFITMPITEKFLGLITGNMVSWQLPFEFYFPFDPMQDYVYQLVYIYEAWLCYKCGIEVLGSDLLFCNFTSIIHMRLEMLDKELLEIDAKDERKSIEDLKLCSDVYQKLYEFNEKLDELYSFSLLGDLLASTVITCLAAFNACLGIKGFPLLKFIVCFFVGLFRIGMQCYHVDRLTRASLRIADSAYENSWYDGSQSYKKMILYIMMRAQKPFNLKAYKFHTLSLESFTDFVRSSYSFFALLRTMYQGDV